MYCPLISLYRHSILATGWEHLSAEPEWFPIETTSCREDQMNMRFRNKGPGIKNICQLL